MKGEMTASVVQIQAREILSVNQVGLLLGISRWTVQRMIRANKIKTFSIGSRRLIMRQEIDKLLKTK